VNLKKGEFEKRVRERWKEPSGDQRYADAPDGELII
jgi:hypothetical protein